MPAQADQTGLQNLTMVAVGILGGAALALSLTVWWLRVDAIDDASKDTANFATMLAEQTTRSVQAIELVLDDVAEEVKQTGIATPEAFRTKLKDKKTFDRLTERLHHLTNGTLVALIDNGGQLVSSTKQWPLPQTDLTDHENFQYFKINDDKRLYIARPVADRFKGEQTVLFSKRINDANHVFLGMASVGVKLSYFQQIYRSIESLPDQTFMLLRTDGTVIIRYPDSKARTDGMMPPESPWHKLVLQGGGTYRSPGYFDGIARQVAVRPLTEYSLVIDVGVSEAAALAGWRTHAIFIGFGTLLALICSAYLLKILNSKIGLLVASEAKLKRANVTIDAALNNLSQGLVMFDSSARLVVCNQRYLEMYGLSVEVVRPGCTLRELLGHRVEVGNFSHDDLDRYIVDLLDAIGQGKVVEKLTSLSDGRIISIVNSPAEDGGWVATHEDVTEKKRAEERIAHAAHHDALTGLPNRLLFAERLEQALTHVRRGNKLAVLYIDLDHLKRVNDTLGHPIGDRLLKAVADRLRSCIREIDSAGRLSGDEFAIIQSPINHPADAAALATRICEAIRTPINLEGHHVVVDTSIGISIAPNDGTEIEQLLKAADIALYEAKNGGRGTHCFYDNDMNERMQVRGNLERDLRDALANGEFELFYQPIVNLQSNRISAFEALLRWHHPERGMVSPLEFIPIAEEIGLIVPLGEWVLRTACAEAATWPPEISVCVNVSSLQLTNKNLVNVVVSALASSCVSANRLELEITESIFIKNTFASVSTMKQLHELGVRFAMDDFGTGYSSLCYLLSFPFSKLKIDRSFITGISDGKAQAIVRAVADLARNLGMTVTAEGVETPQQLEHVKVLGCTEMQGYLYSNALPTSEIHRLFFTERKSADCAA